MQPVPLGVAGEIYVGGAGVARGYLNRGELTAERFIPDPFSGEWQGRLYKTGDLGRWRPDGAIEYLGRNDQQVKIRGHRVEPGEVEACLMCNPVVKEAVVLAREHVPGERRLVAYVIPAIPNTQWTDRNTEALRTHLKAALPEYMVPSAFVTLHRLPLTPNGKLDQRALPTPERLVQQYETPQGPVEEILAEIWQGLLHVQRVGRRDDFFELGGHSLIATQLMVRIRSSLAVDVPMRAVFRSPILWELAAEVEGLRQAGLRVNLDEGGAEIEELLAGVAAMPDSEVRRLMQELTTGGTP
jgi:hypothetical protein